MPQIRSKYRGVCPRCEGTIEVGDLIYAEAKRWNHVDCPVEVESDGPAAVLAPRSAFGWTDDQYDAAFVALFNP